MPNKAVASAAGGGLSGAIVSVGVYFFGHDLPPEVAAALTTIVSALIGAVSAYVTPHNGGNQ